jgi:8-oxo-dGTP pyrophosphatase MutT (NUDIX family)
MPRVTSCGVLVTDGNYLLLGHATHSPRWDIPKGIAEPGEDFRAAALRELDEETGLAAPPEALRELGRHAYLPGKDLVLFYWTPPEQPRPEALVCRSTFALPGGALAPEFDRFGVFDWDTAFGMMGKNLARVLAGLRGAIAARVAESATAPH